MSIIGPRPLLVSYLPWYTEEEKQRHDVRPGLSGLAQVNGRNSVTWEEKFSWDLKYVDRIAFGVPSCRAFCERRHVLYLMNRFTVCFGGVWRRIGRIQRGSLI